LRAFRDFDKIESRTSGCNSKYSVRYSWTDCSTTFRTSGFPNLVFQTYRKASNGWYEQLESGNTSNKLEKSSVTLENYDGWTYLCLTFKFWAWNFD
jgi:hypothetical protein